MQSADHVMDAWRDDRKGHKPTLVIGASIVMEWIRAIEECLRCELPDGVRVTKNKKNYLTYFLIKKTNKLQSPKLFLQYECSIKA